jgi:Cu+-exporting ATPase
MKKEKFDITGMTCSACSSRVEKSVSKLPGIEEVSVNLLTNSMQVSFKEDELTQKDIIAAVEHEGYGASVKDNKLPQGNAAPASSPIKKEKLEQSAVDAGNFKTRLWVSFGFLIPLMYLSMGHMIGLPAPSFLSGHANGVSFAFTQLLLCLPVVYVNRNFFIKGFKTLSHLAPNMDSLVAIGSMSALIYGIFAIYRMSYGLGQQDMDLVARYHGDLYFESAAMILALITLGKYLEARSKGRTSDALRKMMDLVPKTALVERDGQEIEVPVEYVALGETVLVKPGSSIPVDGVILEGVTSVDESAITGESIPAAKAKGDQVIGATINKGGFIKIQATKVGEDTTFAKIIALVEEASATKAPIAKLADKIAGVFVPIIMVIALVTFLVWIITGASFEFALSSAITVLVIACPCALGLATPVAIMVGTGKGAENGILIKSGEALEQAHHIDCVVFDKTGTITEGKPVVTDLMPVGMDERELVSIAAGLEAKSEHPLAEAILKYAADKNIPSKDAKDFQAISGMGIEAYIDGKRYLAGNQKYLQQENVSCSKYTNELDKLASQGKTPLLFARDNEFIGVIAVADVVKPSSMAAIEKLHNLGLKVIMLTGDNKRTAEGIGRNLALDDIIADVLPQDKERVISKLQEDGRKVAMVGDGINDAPALVRADVGIAIGAGTDVAMESADIVLMHNDLRDVATAIRLSKAVIRNIKENLFWAFFYNCLGVPVAAGVFYSWLGWRLNPMVGAAAMSFSSIFVVTNALRLKRFQSENRKGELEDKDAINQQEAEVNHVYCENININQEKIQEEKKMITLKVEGMMCQHCVKHVKEALEKLDGVQATVDLDKKTATVMKPDSVSVEECKKAVADAGYEVVEVIE